MATRWITGVPAALLVATTAAAVAADTSRTLLQRIEIDHFKLPRPAHVSKPLRLWATWYHVYLADAAPAGVPLPDVAGKPLSPPILGHDWCLAALQGVISIRAADGSRQTYTYESTEETEAVDCARQFPHGGPWTRAAGRSRFGVSRGPFGDGAGDYQIVPFRTLAVDTNEFPLGTVFFIPAARGLEIRLHSGRKVRHDGYFFASDRGGGIKENHVDVFVGNLQHNPFPSFVSSTPGRTFEAYIVTDERVRPHLQRLHKID